MRFEGMVVIALVGTTLGAEAVEKGTKILFATPLDNLQRIKAYYK